MTHDEPCLHCLLFDTAHNAIRSGTEPAEAIAAMYGALVDLTARLNDSEIRGTIADTVSAGFTELVQQQVAKKRGAPKVAPGDHPLRGRAVAGTA